MEKDEHFLKQRRNKRGWLWELVIVVPLVFYSDENSLLASEKVRRFDLLLISPGKFSIIMKRRCKWMDGWRGVWSLTWERRASSCKSEATKRCVERRHFGPIKEPISPERPELSCRLKKYCFCIPGNRKNVADIADRCWRSCRSNNVIMLMWAPLSEYKWDAAVVSVLNEAEVGIPVGEEEENTGSNQEQKEKLKVALLRLSRLIP